VPTRFGSFYTTLILSSFVIKRFIAMVRDDRSDLIRRNCSEPQSEDQDAFLPRNAL